ncbi:MAG: hypothetical protein NVS3B21_19430 [Acidimicrobiales bacterium]
MPIGGGMPQQVTGNDTPGGVTPETARKMWRSLEPIHGLIYFVPEAASAYRAVGVDDDRMGYFASRAAPMGAVGAEVVIATFFNFHPPLVHRVVPRCWTLTSPAAILAARLDAADEALRRILGDEVVASPGMARAAELARTAATSPTMSLSGRPLYAGHASLEWPHEPHLVLWHALSLLREYRGDGHIAAMTAEGVDGCEALVIHGATGDVPAAVLQGSRAWPDDEWAAAVGRLTDRGWLDASGALTPAGTEHRQRVEDITDRQAAAPWVHLGAAECDELRTLGREYSKAVVAAGTFTAGLPGARPPA